MLFWETSHPLLFLVVDARFLHLEVEGAMNEGEGLLIFW